MGMYSLCDWNAGLTTPLRTEPELQFILFLQQNRPVCADIDGGDMLVVVSRAAVHRYVPASE